MIQILIRHKQGREQLLERCIKSIVLQQYPDVRIVISVENQKSKMFAFMQPLVDKVILVPDQHYNLHCNDLMNEVKDEGYFMFLDDDDYLEMHSLHKIAPHLDGDGLIVQFKRGRHIKPPERLMKEGKIIKGLIGGGCLILHSKHKNLAKWEGKPAGDYDFIKTVSEKVNLKFVPIVCQIAGNNGLHGK